MATTIEFDWERPEKVNADFARLLRERVGEIEGVPERAVRRGTFALLAEVQDRMPKVTSTLVRSTSAKVDRKGDTVEGVVGTFLAYARYVEEGTGVFGPKKRPIVIEPRSKRGLFWGEFDGGKPVIRKRVVIQGMKPRAPFARATAAFLPRWVPIIEAELGRIER